VCGVWCSEFPERECCDEDLIFAPEVIAPPPRSADADLAPGGIVPDDPDSNFFPEFIPELSHNIDDPEGPFRPLDVDNSVSTTTGTTAPSGGRIPLKRNFHQLALVQSDYFQKPKHSRHSDAFRNRINFNLIYIDCPKRIFKDFERTKLTKIVKISNYFQKKKDFSCNEQFL
jgi:hypothetical protein